MPQSSRVALDAGAKGARPSEVTDCFHRPSTNRPVGCTVPSNLASETGNFPNENQDASKMVYPTQVQVQVQVQIKFIKFKFKFKFKYRLPLGCLLFMYICSNLNSNPNLQLYAQEGLVVTML